jgi:hypothetical protein
LKTDVIIFLDSYLVTNKKEIVSLFNGVIHKHPQVLSIICLRTPDLSVSNYKEKYPHSHINLNTMVTALPPHEADLFQELVYPEMNNCNRRYYNTLVKERLAGWMQLKDKTLYEPCLLPFKSLPLKSPNPWNLSSDQGTPTESEDSIVEGLKTLEHAWDKAYDELYRTIYGDD